MKKNILFSTLVFTALILGCNVSQATPFSEGPRHMGKPSMHANMRHKPAPPPAMHRPPMHHHDYHRGHYLRRNVIYANYGWGYPHYTWNVAPRHYHGNYVSIGFGF